MKEKDYDTAFSSANFSKAKERDKRRRNRKSNIAERARHLAMGSRYIGPFWLKTSEIVTEKKLTLSKAHIYRKKYLLVTKNRTNEPARKGTFYLDHTEFVPTGEVEICPEKIRTTKVIKEYRDLEKPVLKRKKRNGRKKVEKIFTTRRERRSTKENLQRIDLSSERDLSTDSVAMNGNAYRKRNSKLKYYD